MISVLPWVPGYYSPIKFLYLGPLKSPFWAFGLPHAEFLLGTRILLGIYSFPSFSLLPHPLAPIASITSLQNRLFWVLIILIRSLTIFRLLRPLRPLMTFAYFYLLCTPIACSLRGTKKRNENNILQSQNNLSKSEII